MVAVIQRVSHAMVKVEGNIHGEIGTGLLVLLGVAHGDTKEDLVWLMNKIAALRVFSDKEGKMNLSISQVDGEILLISQFTLLASTKKGNRPSYIDAANPDVANEMYLKAGEILENLIQKPTQMGVFGADMKVSLINDGPVTITIDTQNKK